MWQNVTLTTNSLFVNKNMTRIIHAQYITLHHKLHFLPQNYSLQNVTFNYEFTFNYKKYNKNNYDV